MKYYTSIEYLPIFNYFKCTEGDLRFMYKCEDVDEAPKLTNDLLDAWGSICNEWDLLMDDSKTKEMRMKYFKLLKLRRELVFLEGCIVLLAVQDDEDIIKELKSKRYNYNTNDKLTSLKQLNGEYLNIKAKIKEIEDTLSIDVSDDYNHYDLISTLEKHKGFQINQHTTTVSTFIAYLKEFKRWQTK